MKRYILLLALFFLVSASVAQTKHTDPRPLKGLDASKIPVLKSWKDFKPVPGGLLKGAIEIGKANYQPLKMGPEQSMYNDVKNPQSNAQSFWRILRAPNGTANWMWHIDSKNGGIVTQSIAKPDGIAILTSLKTALRIADPKSEFYPMSDQTDEKGYRHLRYGQIYQGVPVWNRDLYIHLDPSGEPTIINGTYEPTPVNITTTPAIANPYSILIAIADLKAQNKWAPVGADVAKVLGRSDPSAKLVLYPAKDSKLHLAYEVSVIPNLLESYYYIIDATSGEILNKIARQCSVMPVDPKMPPVSLAHFVSTANDAPLQPQTLGFTDATGTDLNGVTQQLRTYQHTDGNFYAIWDLPSYVAATSKLPDQPTGGSITLTTNSKPYDQNAALFHNTSTNNSNWEPTLVSAHHNTLITYSFYKDTFQRKAIDDKNSLITSIIHVTNADGTGMDNAFWDGVSSMIYGDGATDFKPLAGGIDVAAHEMTHGVINSTCNLVYQDQSGSLNESFADCFGVFVDTRNLTVGEDIMKDGKSCLRNLINPHDQTALSDEPAKFSEYNPGTADNGEVHTNSAIPSRACAILITQLGRPDVQRIYYLAMTKYLTRNSQFIDCRHAIQSAATELFGANSTQFNAVGPAFDAVEIFDATGTNPSQDDVPPESGGSSIIAFTDINGNIGYYIVGTNTAGFFGSPGSVAHVSNTSAGVDRAQLSAPKNGSRLYFIDSTKHLAFVNTSTGAVSRFNTLFLQQDGDLWNAAVSADESFVALTSAYTNDPNIYIYDGKQIFTQPLMPQTNDGGAVASIDYPDVISFSPNLSKPKIGFDALLDANVGGTSLQYWSMYEIDYTAKRTYELFPSAGTSIDLGNIAYSNTSPNVFTFNSVVGGNTWDVWIADFKNQVVGPINVSQWTIGGSPLTDAEKPSFSPDDQDLAFAAPSNSALIIYQRNPAAFLTISAAVPIFQPYWFMVGGSGVHDAGNISDGMSLSIYPSITSSNATAAITLKTAEEVTLEISNIFGMSVLPIIKERLDEGNHEIKFNTESLATGTYFVRLVTQDGMKVEKIVVER